MQLLGDCAEPALTSTPSLISPTPFSQDPRWGRNLESAGEDPFTAGEYARHFVTGFQTAKEAPYPLQASCTCKHFICNEYEDARTSVDTYVSQQDLVDTYLPPFQACVQEGQASGVMCAYSSMNGQPSCANSWLLKDLLRGAWGFNGAVTSDCDAEGDAAMHTRYPNPDDAVAAILAATTDLDCGGFMAAHVQHALNASASVAADLDAAMLRMFTLRLRLGHFNPPGPLQAISTSDVCSPYAQELARDGVRQSVVLVKNTGSALPLTASAYASALVVGPNYNLIDTLGYYSGPFPCNGSKWTPFDAILQHLPRATALAGVPSVGSNDTSGVAAAAAAAALAPLVVLAIGSDLSLEQEGHDRTSLAFSPGQQALIAAVTAAATGPVVALVFSGGAMDVSSLLSNPKVAGVLVCGQPSVAVLGAGDVLFGRTPGGAAVAPAARMSQMTYPSSFTANASIADFGMRPSSPGAAVYNPGRTYRFFTGTPVLPFGYGLSYTSWNYTVLPDPAPPAAGAARLVSLAGVEAAAVAQASTGVVGHIPDALKATAAEFWVNVSNTGAVDSADVVLGFLTPPGAGAGGVPLQELFGFERVFVRAGETVTVYLGCQGVRFTQPDTEGVRRVLRGQYTVQVGVRETAAHGMGFAEFTVSAE